MPSESSQPSILIIDDDDEIRYSLGRVLGAQGYRIEAAESGEEGLEKLQAGPPPDLVFADIRMKGMSGLEALQHMRAANANLQVVLMTAFGTAQTAIEAMKYGAYDYIMKPFDAERALQVARKALEATRDLESAKSYRKKINFEDYEEGIVGNSPAMQEVFKVIGQVAASDATALLTGESGTGKELIASCIYRHSLRSGGPFLAVNCAAIPENLIESELFGHEKGAFTGAANRRIGKFEQCDRGTIFLDEIGDMALATQTKILRVLQEGEIQRVGGTETIRVDVRVIAATNKDLERMVEERTFREDLYYRLNVFRIKVPPLRERAEDIPEIVDYMLQSLRKDRKARASRVSAEAMEALARYPWPGNVRELGNVVYRSAVVAQGDAILLKDLPDSIARRSPAGAEGKASREEPPEEAPAPPVRGACEEAANEPAAATAPPASLSEAMDFLYQEIKGKEGTRILDAIERNMIKRAIADTGGNQARAAEILGITRNTLKKRLDEYAAKER